VFITSPRPSAWPTRRPATITASGHHRGVHKHGSGTGALLNTHYISNQLNRTKEICRCQGPHGFKALDHWKAGAWIPIVAESCLLKNAFSTAYVISYIIAGYERCIQKAVCVLYCDGDRGICHRRLCTDCPNNRKLKHLQQNFDCNYVRKNIGEVALSHRTKNSASTDFPLPLITIIIIIIIIATNVPSGQELDRRQQASHPRTSLFT
jgi:hypothetical protein